jgi:integrative and conjugative element protein (TIGR02256 family)
MSQTVWVAADAVATMEAEARRFRLRETGGALFGYKAGNGDLVVTESCGPGPNATHHRFRLVPDRDHTQAAIYRILKSSQGRDTYLGEWHSHPLGRPRPSTKDIETLDDISSQEGVRLPRPVALIQQTKPIRMRTQMGELGAFRWNPESERLDRLSVEICQAPTAPDGG